MSNVEIKINNDELRNILKSDAMQQMLIKQANRVVSRAGSGYAADPPHTSSQRAIVNVYAETSAAKRDNLKNNTLLKAMGG